MSSETQRSSVPTANSAALSTLSSSPPPPAHPPTADSPTLSGLPTELVIKIYKASTTFVTAERVSKTSRRLHEIWKIHADAILPAVVECFPQAQELARVQEGNPPKPLCLYLQQTTSSFSQPTITTADRICKNVNLVSSVLCAFKYQVIVKFLDCVRRRREGLAPLRPTEEEDFIRASYRAMTIAAMTNCSIPLAVLESLDMLAYMQMREAMTFMKICSDGRLINFGCRPTNVPHASYILSIFHKEFRRLPCFDQGFWKSLPDTYYTLADGYQSRESKRGARLAELLPVLEEQCALTKRGLTCSVAIDGGIMR